ncbi:hypothetical protein BJ741DRAFT_663205 [Chytriomyces cf. hyalinus JEL632]|nr:hypothetical protein BJ741DRAFT_663205 [Chytriomyces cf. hyalinus JEL632]
MTPGRPGQMPMQMMPMMTPMNMNMNMMQMMPMSMPMMQMRPMPMPMPMHMNGMPMRPPQFNQQNTQQQQMPHVKSLLPYVNNYAARVKEPGATVMIMPPTGIVVVGKRKRATRVDNVNLDDEIGSLSNSEIEDDPNDIDAEAADDRLRMLQRTARGKVDPATLREQLSKEKSASAITSSSSKQPMRRLKKTRHEYLLPAYRDSAATISEMLVPIRLDLELEGMKLKDSFMWNLKERFITPKKFAEFLCEDLDVPASIYGAGIEESMKAQIAEHLANLSGEVPFEEDSRIVINLDILFNQYHLIDRFEWDLSSDMTPEQFALQLSQDLGLGSEFPPLVACAIHEQIAKVKNVVVAIGSSNPQMNNIDDVDEANLILGMLRESTRALDVGFRGGREQDIEEWGPIVEEMGRETFDKYIAEKEKEKARKGRSNRASGTNRRKSGFFIDSNASYMKAETLDDGEETWGSPEERSAWKLPRQKYFPATDGSIWREKFV